MDHLAASPSPRIEEARLRWRSRLVIGGRVEPERIVFSREYNEVREADVAVVLDLAKKVCKGTHDHASSF
jgi:hypothetical protein